MSRRTIRWKDDFDSPNPFLLADTCGLLSSSCWTVAMLSSVRADLRLPDRPLFKFRLVPSSWYFLTFFHIVDLLEHRDRDTADGKLQQLAVGSQCGSIRSQETPVALLSAASSGKQVKRSFSNTHSFSKRNLANWFDKGDKGVCHPIVRIRCCIRIAIDRLFCATWFWHWHFKLFLLGHAWVFNFKCGVIWKRRNWTLS